MKIAVATNGSTLEDLVGEEFEKSAYLLIVEMDDMSYKVYQNEEQTIDLGLTMAKKLIDEDCEALICGTIEEPAFECIVEAQVTRYLGVNYSAKEALNMMENYQLELIREYNGKEWDPLNHAHNHNDGGDGEDLLMGMDSMSTSRYSDTTMQHFMFPRNAGMINNADGEGKYGDPECGDSLTIYIKVENNVITDIKYLVFGCPGSISTSSMTSVLAKGKTLEEAYQITEDEIVKALGGLPEEKQHCSLLGVKALRNAIEDYHHKNMISSDPNI